MANVTNRKDLIQAIRFYIDKIVSDPTIGGDTIFTLLNKFSNFLLQA